MAQLTAESALAMYDTATTRVGKLRAAAAMAHVLRRLLPPPDLRTPIPTITSAPSRKERP